MLNIVTGVEKTPLKICIYGAEGVGKSTLAANMPNPLFLDTEGGTSRLNVRRIKISSWEELTNTIKEIITQPEVCKTLVIDTADWAENLCIDYICNKYRKASIEEFGFGKGYTYLGETFAEFLKLLNDAIYVGINTVIIAHGKPRKYELPEEQGQFDRWEMKLSKQVCPLIKEWCDMLLFCNYKTFVVTTENNTKKAQGGKRVMYTSHHPTFDAKNRFSLPDELDLDFSSISSLFTDVEPKKGQETPHKEAPASNPILEKVLAMIKEAGVTEEDVVKVVASRNHYPEAKHIADYNLDFLQRWMIPNFKKIIEIINSNKGEAK